MLCCLLLRAYVQDDGMFEKCGLAQEAQKVAQNLAAAAAAGTFGGATPFPGKRAEEG